MTLEDKKLLEASWQGSLEDLMQAIEDGACANVQNSIGLSALHIALKNNHDVLVSYLVDKITDIDLNTHDKYGYSVLHDAVKKGSLELVKLLVNAGADIGVTTNDNQTPYQLALSYSQFIEDEDLKRRYNSIVSFFNTLTQE